MQRDVARAYRGAHTPQLDIIRAVIGRCGRDRVNPAAIRGAVLSFSVARETCVRMTDGPEPRLQPC